MDSRTGDLYPSIAAALLAGVPTQDIVELRGPEKAVRRIKLRVRRAARDEERRRKARRKMQKASRRTNCG